MVSFKKNDKIIIIVAVIVLFTAGIGVAMYQSPKTPDTSTITPSGEKTYEVVMNLQDGYLNAITDFAGKKSPYEGTIKIMNGNIKSITFNLTWIDDHLTFFKRMGLDTLTLEVTTPSGDIYTETNQSAPITGEGKLQKTIDFNIIPPVTPIKADNEKDAQAKLKAAPYYDDSMTDKDFTIKVSCQIGEFRILKKLRDKGNDFDLQITYQYYQGSLKEDKTVPTGQDDTPPEDPWTPPYMSMIISTGCGRYI